MNRRELIFALASATSAWPHAARAQQPKMLRLGFVGIQPRDAPIYTNFLRRMTQLGYQEGRNFTFDYIQTPNVEGYEKNYRALAARKVALEPRMIEVKGEEDYAGAFAAMEDVQGQPVILPAGAIFLRDRAAIAQALLERRIPSIAAFRENLQAGALISYGYDLMGLFYDIAGYVHQIARGARPADMPIEQSPRFYMAVNLNTAASLGVSLSDVFIARANEVTE